jgi:hypothetical protein
MAKVFILARWTTGVFCDASTPTPNIGGFGHVDGTISS